MSLNKNIMRVSRMNSKIQRTSLQSEIIRYIQNYIQENGLKPGDRLPSQEKLIEMMGVSRTSLREAMKTLEARNVLEAKNGKGIYVGSQEVNDLLRLIDFAKEKELLLDIAAGSGDHLPGSILLQQGCDLKGALEIISDGYYAHIEVPDTKGGDEIWIGTVSNLCTGYIGKHSIDLLFINIDGHGLVLKLRELHCYMSSESS